MGCDPIIRAVGVSSCFGSEGTDVARGLEVANCVFIMILVLLPVLVLDEIQLFLLRRRTYRDVGTCDTDAQQALVNKASYGSRCCINVVKLSWNRSVKLALGPTGLAGGQVARCLHRF